MADKVKSGVFAYSVTQTIAWIKREFELYSDRSLFVQMVSGPTELRQLTATLKKPDGSTENLTYPYLLATIGEISGDSERGFLKKPRSDGNGERVVGKGIRDHTAFVETLRPVKVIIGISMRTDSYEDLVDIVHALLMAAPAVNFTMTGAYGFKVDTKLQIDPALTTPPINNDGPGEQYTFETTLTLNTYIGVASATRLISNFTFNVLEDNYQTPFAMVQESSVLENLNVSFMDYFREGHIAFLKGKANGDS